MCEFGCVLLFKRSLFSKTDCWAIGIKALQKLGHHQRGSKKEDEMRAGPKRKKKKQKKKEKKITAVYQIVPR